MVDSDERDLQISETAPGLRERKRVALRRRIQGEAVRIFTERGYDATTVEEIAEASETSLSTFYRYFPTKEDVVVWDDVDVRVEAALLATPPGEPLPLMLHVIAEVIPDAIDADHDFHLARMRLTNAVPVLAQAHYARGVWSMVRLLQRLVVDRGYFGENDYRVELVAASVTAVAYAAIRRWSEENGAAALDVLMDQALRAIAPTVAHLSPDTARALPDRPRTPR